MSSSYYRQQLESYLSTLDINVDQVFDVGGKQNPIKKRTKSWTVKEYYILDLPDYNVEIPQEQVRTGDLVFCLEVFEYIISPVIAMKNIANLLKKDGKAIISVPLIYPWHNETNLDSLRYTENGLKRIVETADMKVDKIIYRKTKTNTLAKYYAEDGMRGAKSIADHNVTGYIFEITK